MLRKQKIAASLLEFNRREWPISRPSVSRDAYVAKDSRRNMSRPGTAALSIRGTGGPCGLAFALLRFMLGGDFGSGLMQAQFVRVG